ncbi:MAG: DUF402 domain-containing protein [Anaerolineales bacterium]
MSKKIAVVKCNHLGVDVFHYEGEVLKRTEDEILIKAYFGLEQGLIVDIPINKGDKFLETYFARHWYNIYEIRDRANDCLKGWYCNVTYPPEIGVEQIVFSDLALDLVVYPDGRQVVLDNDEFQALNLVADVQHQALAALADLQNRFSVQFGKL